jgi:hypothetical protein
MIDRVTSHAEPPVGADEPELQHGVRDPIRQELVPGSHKTRRSRVVRGERLTPELGDACLRARKMA